MKKILFVLVAILFAAPAWADVNITAAVDPEDNCMVIISFDATDEPNLVRAFSLDIQADNDANIASVTLLSADYVIHPGTIVIDTQGKVTDYGSPAAPQSDLPSDTLEGPPDGNGVTLEMASLYAPVGPGSPNAPDPSGDLVAVTVDADCTLTITANVSRAGSSGVVMESPDEVVTVNMPAPVVVTGCGYEPTCWDATECAGQPNGDATCDGGVNFADLIALKLSWLKNKGDVDYNCCADFDQSGAVNFADLIRLKLGWLSSGHSPATGNQNCPP
jgi:hypothetical protein